jgi:hypothetical protein
MQIALRPDSDFTLINKLALYFLLVLRGILAGSRKAIAKKTTPNANAVTKI